MNKLTTALCVVTLAILEFSPAFAADDFTDAASGLGLVLRTDKTNYHAGERIVLEIVVTNQSARATTVFQDMFPAVHYTFQITGDDGKNVPMTRMGNSIFFGELRSRGLKGRYLEPGQTHKNPVVLNQLFDLTLPQKYSIVVSRSFSGSTNETVRSKPIEIEVMIE